MTDPEAETFLQAAQARMYFARVKCTVTVDDTVWVLGFAKDTPYRLDTGPIRFIGPHDLALELSLCPTKPRSGS
jgi:hypothetical protein